MYTLEQAQSFNVPAFTLVNGLRNENDTPISFDNHKFLIQPYNDRASKLVCLKASQVGFSTLAIIRAFHLAKYDRANVIYTLPSRTAVKDFVIPKVDPLISHNPVFRSMVGSVANTGIKSIADRFVYFRGSWEESAAISISAHVLINDEVDRSNSHVLETYESRLDAAKLERPDLGYIWKFSNPSIPGAGVDVWWQESDKKHWFIKCPHCNKQQYLDFPNNIDFEKKEYVCFQCHGVLSPDDRRYGHWIPKYFGRDISGYWFNRMMAPWVDASEIIEKSKGDQATFNNFTLGKPYISSDDKITRQSLLKCVVPDYNPMTDVAMGVDVGNIRHYVIGNRYGIFRIGTTDSWEEIESLILQYNATCVIDANPQPTVPTKLAEKYRGQVFVHYYEQDKKQLGTIRFGEGDNRGVVKSDRTKIIDALVAEFNQQRIYINIPLYELDDKGFIKHFENCYRVVVETPNGAKKAEWLHLEGKPDHYLHASIYWRIALTKTLDRGQIVRPKPPSDPQPIAPPSTGNNQVDLDQIVKDALARPSRDWKSI